MFFSERQRRFLLESHDQIGMVNLTFSYVLRPSGNTSFYAISKINFYLVTDDKKNVSCKELMRRHVLCVWVMLSICQYLTWTYWIIRLSGVCLTAGETPPLTGGPHHHTTPLQ